VIHEKCFNFRSLYARPLSARNAIQTPILHGCGFIITGILKKNIELVLIKVFIVELISSYLLRYGAVP
jgi:hypothetical protein